VVVDTPFFPQESKQCGPAALASVLTWAGRATTPKELAPQVYLPGRQGSLQAELLAAARAAGRVGYRVKGGLEGLVRELEAGHPVLVLQNLAFSRYPRWHYAVVFGFDRNKNRLLLHSGRKRRRAVAPRHFLRSWGLADQWAVVVLPPDRLPATASETRVLRTGYELEQLGRAHMAEKVYRAAAVRWRDSEAPLVARANLHFRNSELKRAESILRRAVKLDPGGTALNNLAFVLARRGRLAEAEVLARQALRKDASAQARDTLRQIERALQLGLEHLPAEAESI